MSEKLLSCPFCGSKNLQHARLNIEYYDKCYCVYCLNCDARGPEHIDIDEAISAWNKRK